MVLRAYRPPSRKTRASKRQHAFFTPVIEKHLRDLGRSDETLPELFGRLLQIEHMLQSCQGADEALWRGVARTRDALLLEIAARDAKCPLDFNLKFQAFKAVELNLPEHGLLEAVAHASLRADLQNLCIPDAAEIHGVSDQ